MKAKEMSVPPTKVRRRWPWALVAVGAVIFASAFVWKSEAVPRLEKFPSDLDTTLNYSGTFTQYVDPSTAAPLPTPLAKALNVDRHVFVVSSTSDTAVVREDITIKIEGMKDGFESHQYVIDRTTMQNLKSPQAWAFKETNVLDRAGTYRINFPMKLTPGTVFPSYKDETATRLEVPSDPAILPEKPNGVTQVVLRAEGANVPLTDAYLQQLDSMMPMPRQLTLVQLQPALLAAGVDVDATLKALVPVISQADLSILGGLAGNPIKLQYVTSFAATTTVNPPTGANLDVKGVSESVGAMPDAAALPPLLDVLGRYMDVPEVAKSVNGLKAMAAQPMPLFKQDYQMTPASLDSVSSDVADMVKQMNLAETTVPWALGILGFVMALAGAVLLIIRKPVKVEGPAAGEPVDEQLPELTDHDLAQLLQTPAHEMIVTGADGRGVDVHTPKSDFSHN